MARGVMEGIRLQIQADILLHSKALLFLFSYMILVSSMQRAHNVRRHDNR